MISLEEMIESLTDRIQKNIKMSFKNFSKAHEFSKNNIDAEVIDLRTVCPLDEETIFESVKKTGRLVVVDTGWTNCGVASEISARVTEKIFTSLKSPVVRMAMPDAPVPTSVALEKVFYHDSEDIACVVKNLISGKEAGKRKTRKAIMDEEFKGPF